MSKSSNIQPSSPSIPRMDSSNNSSFAAVLRDLAKNAGDLEHRNKLSSSPSPSSSLLDVRKVSTFIKLFVNKFFKNCFFRGFPAAEQAPFLIRPLRSSLFLQHFLSHLPLLPPPPHPSLIQSTPIHPSSLQLHPPPILS